jgi:hypothetical protein
VCAHRLQGHCVALAVRQAALQEAAHQLVHPLLALAALVQHQQLVLQRWLTLQLVQERQEAGLRQRPGRGFPAKGCSQRQQSEVFNTS